MFLFFLGSRHLPLITTLPEKAQRVWSGIVMRWTKRKKAKNDG